MSTPVLEQANLWCPQGRWPTSRAGATRIASATVFLPIGSARRSFSALTVLIVGRIRGVVALDPPSVPPPFRTGPSLRSFGSPRGSSGRGVAQVCPISRHERPRPKHHGKRLPTRVARPTLTPGVARPIIAPWRSTTFRAGLVLLARLVAVKRICSAPPFGALRVGVATLARTTRAAACVRLAPRCRLLRAR